MLSYTKEILRFLSQEQILNGEAFFIYIDEKGEKKISLNLTNTIATQFEFIRMKFLHAIRSAHSRNFFFFSLIMYNEDSDEAISKTFLIKHAL